MFSSSDLFQSLAGGALFAALLYGLTACGDIAPRDNGDAGALADAAGPSGDGGAPSGAVRFSDPAAASGHFTVDASDAERWVYVDLDARTEARPADPAQDAVWDLAFRRFHVAMNGGVSGQGAVGAALVDDVPFDAVGLPRGTAFRFDAADGADEDALPDYVFSGGLDPWYAYDVGTHVLTPKARVFVVRTSAGATVKVAIERYYDDAGGSGHPTLRYAPAPSAPAPSAP